MALFDLAPRDAAHRRLGPAAADSDEMDFDALLVREQYRSLARIAPYHCGVAIVAAVMLGAFVRERAPPRAAIFVLAGSSVFVLVRLIHWLQVRHRVERLSLGVIRRGLRQAEVEIPTLTFVFGLIAATTFRQGGLLEESLMLVASWIIAAACALTLLRLARCSVLVIAAATAPIEAAFLARGGPYALWLAVLLLIASSLIGVMLIENSRAFSEIAHSRFAIAKMHRAAEEARRTATAMASTDYLTGLPNRRFLLSLLADRAEAGEEGAKPFAVGLIDLDGFKPINDIHGHQAGDAILKQAGDRLADVMERRGCAARMGGDEFAVVCEGVASRDEAVALGGAIREAFAAPFQVEKIAVHVGCTSGFALFPASADQPDRLLRLADLALYRAKTQRRGDLGVFDAADENAAIARVKLEQALHRAVASSCVGVHFQPIVELATARVSGFESLARWTDPRLGAIEPAVFIPVAEQIGLIDQLSRDLLRKATTAASRWPDDLSLSFNLSAGQLGGALSRRSRSPAFRRKGSRSS
jgi:diguanylate cyclase (GGDEF)-like protein